MGQLFSNDQHIPAESERELALKTPVLPGRQSQALNHRNKFMYRQNDGSTYSLFESTEQLMSHGAGIVVYFRTLEALLQFYAVAAVVSIGPIVANSRGSGYAKYKLSPQTKNVVSLTLGNRLPSSEAHLFFIPLYLHILIWAMALAFVVVIKRLTIKYAREEQLNPQLLNPHHYSLFVRLHTPLSAVPRQQAGTLFGRVYDLVPVFDFSGQLLEYRQLSQLSLQAYNLRSKSSIHDVAEFDKLIAKIAARTRKLRSIQEQPSIIAFFATYETKAARREVALRYSSPGLLAKLRRGVAKVFPCLGLGGEERIGGSSFQVQEEDVPNPEDIVWQNLDSDPKSKPLRYFLIVVLFFVTLSISSGVFAVVFILGKASFGSGCTQKPPSFQEATKHTASNATRQCYCKANVADLTQPGRQFCYDYLGFILSDFVVQGLAAVVCTLTGMLYQALIQWGVRFLRITWRQNILGVLTLVSFVSQFLNSAVLPLLICSNIEGIVLSQGVIFVVQSVGLNVYDLTIFQDFSPEWYVNFAPYTLAYLVADLANPVIRLAKAVLLNCCIECRLGLQAGALTQVELNSNALPYQYDLEIELGQILALFFLVLGLAPGIPLLYLLAFFNLLLRYLVARVILLRHSKKVSGLTPKYFNLVGKTLLLAPLLGLLLATWMLTAAAPTGLVDSYRWMPLTGLRTLDRFLGVTVLALLTALTAVLFLTDVGVYNWVFECLVKSAEQKYESEEESGLSVLSRRARRLCSYRMQDNCEYLDIAQECLNRRRLGQL